MTLCVYPDILSSVCVLTSMLYRWLVPIARGEGESYIYSGHYGQQGDRVHFTPGGCKGYNQNIAHLVIYDDVKTSSNLAF